MVVQEPQTLNSDPITIQPSTASVVPSSAERSNTVIFTYLRLIKHMTIILVSILVESTNSYQYIMIFEVVTILYIIIIIYNVINTGSFTTFVVSLFNNIIFFIQFVMLHYSPSLKSVYLHHIYMYIYVSAGVYVLYNAVYSYLYTVTYLTTMYFVMCVDVGSICCLLGSVVCLGNESQIAAGILYSIGTILGGGSLFSVRWKKELVKKFEEEKVKILQSAMKIVEEGNEVILDIPYYVVQTNDHFYKYADQFDILRLSSHFTVSMQGKGRERMG